MSQNDIHALPTDRAMKEAVEHHLAGRVREAEALYRAVLQAQPRHADANHNMGLLAVQAGQAGDALPYLEAALLENPAQGLYALSYAEALLASGRAEEAHSVIGAAIARGFDDPQATALREKAQVAASSERESASAQTAETSPGVADKTSGGKRKRANKAGKSSSKRPVIRKPLPVDEANRLLALFKGARYADLESRTRGLLRQYPDSGLVWKAHWAALRNQGKDAWPALQRAIELAPGDAELHNQQGIALRDLRRLGEAEASCRRALEINPNYAETHNNLGCVYRDLAKLNDAEVCFRRALALDPAYVDALNNLSLVLTDRRRYDEALASCRQSLEIDPSSAGAYVALSHVLRIVGRTDEALTSCRRALELAPESVAAHGYLGNVLIDLGRHSEAAEAYRRVLEFKPDASGVFGNLLFCLSHDETVDARALFAEHCRFGERFEAPLRAAWPAHGYVRDPERCLQVGFVSGDLRNHALACFVGPLFAHLADDPLLSLHAYSNHAVEDAVSARMRGYFKHWNPVAGLSDDALAQQIRDDGIDILIDLSGHTEFNRLLCFARKPAPLQVSWIGYPGTTGLRAMDYFLADRHWLPPGQFDAQFTEKIAYMPAVVPFALPAEDAPPVNVLPVLSNGYLTFGSFNRTNKLSRAVIALWSRLLRALPDARMVLGGLPEESDFATLADWFAQEGVARDRLSFHVRCGMTPYLSLHHGVDICLDTFPYNGGTTTHCALWMGVPTLTVAGNTPAARAGACILGNWGLEAFVARDADDFVAKGVSWAGDIARLSAIRAGMRERFQSLAVGQPARVADGVARTFRRMWRRWCAGLPAESFVLPLEAAAPASASLPVLAGDCVPAAIEPDSAAAHNDQACLFAGQGRFAEAAASFRAALAIRPGFFEAHNNLGNVLLELGKREEAVICFRRALEIRADIAEPHNNLGNALRDLGQPEAAVVSYRRALEIKPVYAEAHNNLGTALIGLARFDEALACFRRAVEVRPGFVEGANNLGHVLRDLGRLDEALAVFRNALKIRDDIAEMHIGLGNILMDLGRHGEAVMSFRRAQEIKPDFSGAYDNVLFAMSLDETVDAPTLFAEHRRFGECFEAPLRSAWPRHDNSKDPDRCLQVGFVSGDLRTHAVAFFVEPLLAHLADNSQLSLHAYSNFAGEDEVTARLQAYFKHWHRVVGLTDDALAQKIRDDGIDILIDLSGHTGSNRLLCFARKPAPIQASWLGYPGTTGLTAMDYFLADRHWLPPGDFDAQFAEKIVYMPVTSPFSAPADAPPLNSLPALDHGYLTFGSFNRVNKLSRSVIALWARLLCALPDSRMVLGGLPEEEKYETLIDWFGQEGVGRDRLSFHARCGMVSYLRLHHEVDICLDTFPYNGGTTTYCALWMGVPTLTLAGKTTAGRAGAAILGQVGLERFVAHDAQDFVARGVAWAGELADLAAIRAGLRERYSASLLGQPALAAAGMGRTFRLMWQRWCAGLPAESFAVPMDLSPQESEMMKAPVNQSPIYVTQPVLPPLEEFIPYLEKIWQSKLLTNGGPFHQELERALCEHLGVEHLALFANGTLALVTALQALRIKGEVITTPYSFVATAHALLWNGIKPVFVDIDPHTLNLDPAKIEAAITSETTAILPVHCYGRRCDVDAIQAIADNYNLKVIYDAAHAFGVRDAQGSILRHGDLSVLSFHATKVFNTFEGGAIICPDAKTKQHIDHLKNFGFVDDVTVVAAGINGKMSEINAAFGLLQLKGIDAALERRKAIDAHYRAGLDGIVGISCLFDSREAASNHAYFPILVGADYPLERDALFNKLKENNVFARRYFFPLISDFPMYRGMPSAAHSNLPVARKVAEQVICLPLYPELTAEQVDFIVQIVRRRE